MSGLGGVEFISNMAAGSRPKASYNVDSSSCNCTVSVSVTFPRESRFDSNAIDIEDKSKGSKRGSAVSIVKLPICEAVQHLRSVKRLDLKFSIKYTDYGCEQWTASVLLWRLANRCRLLSHRLSLLPCNWWLRAVVMRCM